MIGGIKNLFSYLFDFSGAVTNEQLLFAIENDQLQIVNKFLKDNRNSKNNIEQMFINHEPLHLAARMGRVAIVNAFLGVDVSFKGEIDRQNTKENETPLHLAAREGHVDVVSALVNANATTHLVNSKRETPLHLAAQKGHVKVVDVLASTMTGDQINIFDNSGLNALHVAAKEGHAEVIKALARAGVDIDSYSDCYQTTTCLIRAIQNGQLDIVNVLIEAGSNVNKIHRFNRTTPLDFALECEQLDIAKVLTAAGAVKKVDIADVGADVNENHHLNPTTSLAYGLDYEQSDIADVLTAAGAVKQVDIFDSTTRLLNAIRHGQLDIVNTLITEKVDINSPNSSGDTPLLTAIEYGELDIVKALMGAGAALNKTNLFSDTPLPLEIAVKGGRLDIVKALITAGADINSGLLTAVEYGELDVVKALIAAGAALNKTNPFSDTPSPLEIALKRGRLDIVNALITAGADINSSLLTAVEHAELDIVKALITAGAALNKTNPFSDTPLPLLSAVKRGRLDIVKALITAGADVNICDACGNTLLMLAVKRGQLDMVNALITAGAKVDIRDACGDTLLMWSVKRGQLDTVNALIAGGADVNSRNSNEPTLLMLAVTCGQSSMVNALIAGRANINSHDSQGSTALLFAVKGGHLNIVNTLIKAGAEINRSNNLNETPLEIAVENKRLDIVNALIAAGANIDPKISLQLLPMVMKRKDFKMLRELLKIDTFKAVVIENKTSALWNAVKNHHWDMVQIFITIPQIFDSLLRKDAKGLEILLTYACEDLQLGKLTEKALKLNVLDQLVIYGVPFSQISAKIPKFLIEDIKEYFVNPEGYLERNTNYSLNQIQAVRLLKTHMDVIHHQYVQEKASRRMQQAQDPDDPGKIATTLKHFDNVIKPAFKDRFESCGVTDAERLQTIESEIRAVLLDRILKDFQQQLQDENNINKVKTLRAGIAFIDAYFDELKLGQNQNLMREARYYFCSNDDNNHIAWRAYDKGALVKEWPNLLTPPLNNGEQNVYTVAELGKHDLTAASLKVRELAAYSFLLAIDENEGDEATKQNRVENFISQIKDIRRAHNDDNDQKMDKPSCFPGAVGRTRIMWSMHSLALTKKMLELLPEIIKSIVARKFSAALANCETQEQKAELYYSLTMLRKENAQEVIRNQVEFSQHHEWAEKRQKFINDIGSLKNIEEEVNHVLEEISSDDTFTLEQYVYLLQYLADIGGGWSAEMLTSIYRQHLDVIEMEIIKVEEEIANPFAINQMIRDTISKWPERLQMREQSLIAWEIILPILKESFSANEKLETLTYMIATDWARSKKDGLPALELSIFTLEELNSVMLSSHQQDAMNTISQEYLNALNVQIDEIDKTQSNNQEMEGENTFNPENTLIFSETRLNKKASNSESNEEEELTLTPERIRKLN